MRKFSFNEIIKESKQNLQVAAAVPAFSSQFHSLIFWVFHSSSIPIDVPNNNESKQNTKNHC